MSVCVCGKGELIMCRSGKKMCVVGRRREEGHEVIIFSIASVGGGGAVYRVKARHKGQGLF